MEELGVDPLRAEIGQRRPQLGHELLRTAEEPVVGVAEAEGLDHRTEPVSVEATGEQLDVLPLTREDVDDLEPVGEAVLEVVDLVEEHHRAAGAVGVDERDAGSGLALQQGRDDREDRRDAGAGGDRARSAWRAVGSSSLVKRPAGVMTSSSSPTRSEPTTPSEKAPPGSRLTPIRSTPEDGGVQIEKLRRTSSPPRIERCWPWRKA